MEKVIIGALWVLSVLAGGFIGFLTEYLRKKGENLATHEDIALLVDQVRAVTTATKEIEAKISTEAWDRQKRWEMRRDVLFEATKRLAAVREALNSFDVTFAAARKSVSGDAGWVTFKVDANKHWRRHSPSADLFRLGIPSQKNRTSLFKQKHVILPQR
jgi:hypothetical protein